MNTIGVQLFSLPFLLEQDFEKAMGLLAVMGYSEIELFGPFPFSALAAKEHWKAVTPDLGFAGSGYFNVPEDEVSAILKANQLSVPSIHIDIDTAEQKLDELARASERLGFTYITLPMIPEAYRQTLDDYKRMAQRFNVIGEKAQHVGLKFAYHNHGYGLQEVSGLSLIHI